MSIPASYFVAPDADGEVWIWRANGETPVAVVSCFVFRDDPDLWAYLTSDMPHRVEEPTP